MPLSLVFGVPKSETDLHPLCGSCEVAGNRSVQRFIKVEPHEKKVNCVLFYLLHYNTRPSPSRPENLYNFIGNLVVNDY